MRDYITLSEKAFFEGLYMDELFEHRGAPDPRKAAERARMKASGKIRHANAMKRKAEQARKRNERAKKMKDVNKAVKDAVSSVSKGSNKSKSSSSKKSKFLSWFK